MIAHISKYFAISGASLGIDLCSFQLLSYLNLFSIPVIATISYCAGLIFAYSIFKVSIFRKSKYSNRKYIQALLFALSGLLGSTTTYLVTRVTYDHLGANNWESKLSAVAFSFFFVYIFRSKYVFPDVDLTNE